MFLSECRFYTVENKSKNNFIFISSMIGVAGYKIQVGCSVFPLFDSVSFTAFEQNRSSVPYPKTMALWHLSLGSGSSMTMPEAP